jgi:hypothetical protein
MFSHFSEKKDNYQFLSHLNKIKYFKYLNKQK